ncbi:hypothetical protein AB7M45_007799 [Bradyrhizobium elkanii]|uniref:hypothetical protein n=1 Tax=Bradyrhizobium elkanii TaxID=29448 RepID=UPI0009127892|nr:hypothetical protein [Bradyrhizobium elkanii]MCW2195026.1 hypothetical protein [Bradyrhizobium elkanii]NWL67279.1 hypothetical protein [Bradyrhizobium elkanii]OIM94674.1 hypothetical protein BLN97_09390 [Bradyrhizobium elkanii]
MARRFLMGLHPSLGGYGVWLSRPGVDVVTATVPGDFLLKPDTKNEQVILSGSVFLPPLSGDVNIPYTVTLPQNPYVAFRTYIDSGVVSYPYRLDMAMARDLTIGGVVYYEIQNGFRISNSALTFNNTISESYGIYVDYMIFNRSLG